MQYLIVGQSGTGKTAVGQFLQRNGYDFINADDEISHYQNVASGRPVPTPGRPPGKDWLAKHNWVWDAGKFKAALNRHKPKTVFVAGGATNEDQFYDWFDLVFGLYVPDLSITTKRLQSREPERWAHGTPALQRQIDRHPLELQRLVQIKAILIDASGPVEAVASSIQSHITP